MANQSSRPVDEQVSGNANEPNKGTPPNKTPAPARKVSDAGAFGQNRYAGASSLEPGQRTDGKSHDLVSIDDSDLDKVVAQGAGGGHYGENDLDFQTRQLGDRGKVGVHPSMSRQTSVDMKSVGRASLPKKNDNERVGPVRQPR